MIIYLENIAAFSAGIFICTALVWLTKEKPGFVFFSLANSLSGGIIYLILVSLSVLNASVSLSFFTGIFGIFFLALFYLTPFFS